jgi:hypothetical protein
VEYIYINATQKMASNITSTPKMLLEKMSSSNFSGLSGKIYFEEGRLLETPMLRIVNVVGKRYKEIDYWKKSLGFLKKKRKMEVVVYLVR